MFKRLAKTHRQIAKMRLDFLQKVANHFVLNYSEIHVEALKIRNMVRNRHLSMSIQDASWGLFFELLEYKAEESGRQLVKVNPRETSQKCSGCGEIVPKTLDVRIHSCKACGLDIDRDENAARKHKGRVNPAWGRAGPSGANVTHWGERSPRIRRPSGRGVSMADSDYARDALYYLGERLKQDACPGYASLAAFLKSPPDWDYEDLENDLSPVLSGCVKQDKNFAAQLIASKAEQAEVLREFIDKALAAHPAQIAPAFFHSQAEILQKSLDVEEILSSLHWLGLSSNPEWIPLVSPFTGDKNKDIANKAQAVLNQLNQPKVTQR